MNLVEKIAREVCSGLGYDPDMVVAPPVAVSSVLPAGFMTVIHTFPAWQWYAPIVREVLNRAHAMGLDFPGRVPDAPFSLAIEQEIFEADVDVPADGDHTFEDLTHEQPPDWRERHGLK